MPHIGLATWLFVVWLLACIGTFAYMFVRISIDYRQTRGHWPRAGFVAMTRAFAFLPFMIGMLVGVVVSMITITGGPPLIPMPPDQENTFIAAGVGTAAGLFVFGGIPFAIWESKLWLPRVRQYGPPDAILPPTANGSTPSTEGDV